MNRPDTYETAKGPLEITPVQHATFTMNWDGLTIVCDPVGDPEQFSYLKEAPGLVVLTHHHGDHFSLETLLALASDGTRLVAPQIVFDQLPPQLAARTTLMANGDTTEIAGIRITATAMYNVTPERQKYHAKGVGNGYLFDFAGTKVYLASDTEPTPEMDSLGPVDIAFFPMNLPYTMTPDQVVVAIGKTNPRYVYPFHYRSPSDEPDTEPQALIDAMPPRSTTQIVVRDWYGGV